MRAPQAESQKPDTPRCGVAKRKTEGEGTVVKPRLGSLSPGKIAPGLPLTSSPSPQALGTHRGPAAHLGSQGSGESLVMRSVAVRPLRSLRGPGSCLREAARASRRKVLAACRSATFAGSERQGGRPRAARPPEIDRRGPVTSGSGTWLSPHPPGRSFLASPRRDGSRELQEGRNQSRHQSRYL